MAEYVDKKAKLWLNIYGNTLEKNPVIDFNGSLFVFTGLTGKRDAKNHPIVKKVIEKGGQYRSSVSGRTNYLIVNPTDAGATKIEEVLRQRQEGKNIKIILLEDLENALEGRTSSPAEKRNAADSTENACGEQSGTEMKAQTEIINNGQYTLAQQCFADIQAGDSLSFGCYKGEDIEWQVLKREVNKALLISKYALDCIQYHNGSNHYTLKTCTLHKWLNRDFLDSAFSEEEQGIILAERVMRGYNPMYDSQSYVAREKVFLLSIQEARKYFRTDESRRCAPTAYAIKQGAAISNKYTTDDKATCWWWLRTNGYNYSRNAFVDAGGWVNFFGYRHDSPYACVRPALWISLPIGASDSANSDGMSKSLKEVFMLLENGEFENAKVLAEQSLMYAPECAEAYLAILMAELKIKKREDLKYLPKKYETSLIYQNILRFSDNAFGIELK